MRISAWHVNEGDVTIIQIEGRECVYVGMDGRIRKDFFTTFRDVDVDDEDAEDGNYNEDDWRKDR